jgi:hypothetical protein
MRELERQGIRAQSEPYSELFIFEDCHLPFTGIIIGPALDLSRLLYRQRICGLRFPHDMPGGACQDIPDIGLTCLQLSNNFWNRNLLWLVSIDVIIDLI